MDSLKAVQEAYAALQLAHKVYQEALMKYSALAPNPYILDPIAEQAKIVAECEVKALAFAEAVKAQGLPGAVPGAVLKWDAQKYVYNAGPPSGGVPGLLSLFPGLRKCYSMCPTQKCGPGATTLYGLVQHLNDAHKWTREAIADWLDAGAKEHGWDLSARGVLVTTEGIVKVDAPTEGEADEVALVPNADGTITGPGFFTTTVPFPQFPVIGAPVCTNPDCACAGD